MISSARIADTRAQLLSLCRNPRSDYNWTVRDPNQVEEEYRTLEEKLKALTRGLNKRVSHTEVCMALIV